MYASSSMPASSHFLRSYEHEEAVRVPIAPRPAPQFASAPVPPPKPAEPAIEPPPQPREAAPASRPRFSHQPAHARDRKPAQKSAPGRIARRPSRDARSASPRANGSSRHAHVSRWAKGASTNGNGKRHDAKSSSNGNGAHSNGHSRTGNGANGLHKAKTSASRTLRNGHSTNGKPAAKSARRVDASRKGARPGSRPDARGSRKPALTASSKAGNRSRYGFTAASNRRSKKRG
jgi:hypothetical protein